MKLTNFSANVDFFPRENPAKSANFSANLPLKIPQNFSFFSAKYQKPCLVEDRFLIHVGDCLERLTVVIPKYYAYTVRDLFIFIT